MANPGNSKPYDWRSALLAALREVPVLQRACDAADIDRTVVWRAREADPEFSKAYDEAMEAGIDRAEQEAFRRAVEGTQKGIWHQGVLVGSETVYSDAMLGLILKGRRKKVYADRTELTGAEGAAVQVDETARSARVAQLLALAIARKQQADDFGGLA